MFFALAFAVDVVTPPIPLGAHSLPGSEAYEYGLHPSAGVTLPYTPGGRAGCTRVPPSRVIWVAERTTRILLGESEALVFADVDTPIVEVSIPGEAIRAAALVSVERPAPNTWCGPDFMLVEHPRRSVRTTELSSRKALRH